MFGLINTSIFLFLQFIFVQCLIPSLTVRKLDEKFIQRKRQDTLEMCKIFNAETAKLEHKNNRRKREIETLFTAEAPMKENDARRIENIVDKLYDDMSEMGKKVTYRHRQINATGTTKEQKLFTPSGRRFDFAPAALLPPLDNDAPQGQEHNKKTSETSSDSTVPNWPKTWKHGVVPYFIDPKTYDSQLAESIVKAFDYFEKATCIRLQRLREKPTDQQSLSEVEWVFISNPIGIRQCVHSNEQLPNKGVQLVVFGYDCLSIGEIVHELMHILGFSHEHTRPDRDKYISVQWENIKPGYKKYFTLRSEDQLLTLPYDHASVMHYPPRAFSRNGRITLLSKDGIKLGQREGLSETDVEKVTHVFGNECVNRNKDYLLATCPSVVKAKPEAKPATEQEIQDYFKPRIWPYAIVNYKLRDKMEFSVEEKENLKAVFNHIEAETCIVFHDMAEDEYEENDYEADDNEPENIDKEIGSGAVNTTNDSQNDDVNKIDPSFKAEEEMRNDSLRQTIILYDGDKDKPQGLKIGPNLNIKIRKKRSLNYQQNRRHAENILILTRTNNPGCRCPTPGVSGNQVLELDLDCFNSVNDLLHVFVHVLGLDHQHNMHDRDDYLHIVWDKMSPETENELKEKLPPAAAAGFPYDYHSVMHYPWLQIKSGSKRIIYPIWYDGWAMGHWQGLSSIDVQKLNLIYFEQCLERKKHEDVE